MSADTYARLASKSSGSESRRALASSIALRCSPTELSDSERRILSYGVLSPIVPIVSNADSYSPMS